MESKIFIIQIVTEDQLNILARITDIFVRRHIPIKSLELVRNTENKELQITIKLHYDAERISKVVGQINKQIDVIAVTFTVESEALVTP